jgi:hypothetical protein
LPNFKLLLLLLVSGSGSVFCVQTTYVINNNHAARAINCAKAVNMTTEE